MKILYLEDEQNIREVTQEYLHIQGYKVITATDGQEALNLLKDEQFDCAVLDIMVPHINGLEVLDYIMSNNPDTATIMLTALDDELTQIKAFNSQADDYIIKPFSPLILIKRIEAVLRRSQNFVPKQSGLILNKDSYQLYWEGKSLNLTVSEFMIFEALYTNQNQVFTRNQLLEIIAPDDFLVSDRVIDAHVKNIRKKLPVDCIKTVIGIGYKVEADV